MKTITFAITALLLASSIGSANSQPAAAAESTFSLRENIISYFVPRGYIRIAGESGVSIEVPNDWHIVSTQELAEEVRLKPTAFAAPKVEALAMAKPHISGATVAISVQRPPGYTQRKLEQVSEAELRSTSEQMQREFKGKNSQSGIGTVTSGPIYETKVLPGKTGKVLFVTYREEELSPRGRALIWKSTHIHIVRASDEVQITLSYREADEKFWQPVMDYAVASLRY